MRTVWEVTKLWSVIHRTFTPTPNFPVVYEDPGEQNDEPQYEPESEYTSASNSDEAEPASSGSETESDERASEMEAEMHKEEAVEQEKVVRTRKGK